MSANLTVPAAVWACKQPGVPLVAAIVEGEHASDYIDRTNVVNPPAWLVALRDARCDLCEMGLVGPDDDVRPCPRCHNGRLLHDVRVECGNCNHGVIVVRDAVEPTDGDIAPCPNCRTVRCLVDVVPVYDVNALGDQWPALFVTGSFVLRAEKKTAWSFALTSAHVYALAAACGKPPADWPGGYAVILTEVGQ